MWKRIVSFMLAVLFVITVSGCGDSKIINGKEVETYGLFNRDEVRQDNVHYQMVVGNLIWSIVLFETIIAPVYFWGFSMYEPVCVVDANKPVKNARIARIQGEK